MSCSAAPKLPRRKRMASAAATFACVLAGASVVAELVARTISPAPPLPAALNLHTNLRVAYEPRLHGVSSPILHTTNMWGMRGSNPPEGQAWDEAVTIIAVGGSTTQCFYLDDARTWPHVLERALRDAGHNVWVGNAGQDGHTTRGHMVIMDKVVSVIRPDFALLLVGIGDLDLSLAGAARSPYGFDEHMSLALGPGRSATLNFLLDNSRLAYALHQFKERHLDGIRTLALSYEAAIPSRVLAEPEPPIPQNLDDMLPSLTPFRENVRRMILVAKAIGVTPVLLTQPLLFEDGERWRAIRARSLWIGKVRRAVSGATYARLLGRFNQEVLQLCIEHDILCFDLAREVPHSDEFFYDMVHPNDAGAELMGTKVAGFLLDNFLGSSFPRRGTADRGLPMD